MKYEIFSETNFLNSNLTFLFGDIDRQDIVCGKCVHFSALKCDIMVILNIKENSIPQTRVINLISIHICFKMKSSNQLIKCIYELDNFPLIQWLLSSAVWHELTASELSWLNVLNFFFFTFYIQLTCKNEIKFIHSFIRRRLSIWYAYGIL